MPPGEYHGITDGYDEIVTVAGIEGTYLGIALFDQQPGREPTAAIGVFEPSDDPLVRQILFPQVDLRPGPQDHAGTGVLGPNIGPPIRP